MRKRVVESAGLIALVLTLAPLSISVNGGQEAKRTPVDVCALVPRDEALKILGIKIGRARPSTRSDGGSECRYSGGAGTVTLTVGSGMTKAGWDKFMKELAEAGATLQPVPGVGDGAYFWDDYRLYTFTPDYEIAVSTGTRPGGGAEFPRAALVELAKAAVAKLKGATK